MECGVHSVDVSNTAAMKAAGAKNRGIHGRGRSIRGNSFVRVLANVGGSTDAISPQLMSGHCVDRPPGWKAVKLMRYTHLWIEIDMK